MPRERTKNDLKRGNRKKNIQTVFDPSFLHTMLGGALGNGASKKKLKKDMLLGRYDYARNGLPPPRTAYRF